MDDYDCEVREWLSVKHSLVVMGRKHGFALRRSKGGSKINLIEDKLELIQAKVLAVEPAMVVSGSKAANTKTNKIK